MSKLGFLSPDGKCYSFDHRANGYSRGEGVGVVVLKPLRQALQDGNTIRAVIRGSGVNQDGRTPGMTVPSKSAQEKLIRSVYASAGLDLSETDYVEAHGTGTAQGDPIEASAIAAAWSTRVASTPLYVGAVKTNIGHLEGASGVAGVIKTVLALENGVIPPNINFEKCNPKISLEDWNIKVSLLGAQTEAPHLSVALANHVVQFPLIPTPWPDTDVRRASINSFGFGGANAHVVLDDAYNFLRLRHLEGVHRTAQKAPSTTELEAFVKPANNTEPETEEETHNAGSNGVDSSNHHTNGSAATQPPSIVEPDTSSPAAASKPMVFVFSSSDQGGIKRWADTYSAYLADASNQPSDATFLGDLAYTLGEKRSQFPWRSAVVASSREELVKRLPSLGRSACQIRRSTPAKVGFVFTGQGAQWPEMGKSLLGYPVFKQSLEDASAFLETIGCSWNLVGECLPQKHDSVSKANGTR